MPEFLHYAIRILSFHAFDASFFARSVVFFFALFLSRFICHQMMPHYLDMMITLPPLICCRHNSLFLRFDIFSRIMMPLLILLMPHCRLISCLMLLSVADADLRFRIIDDAACHAHALPCFAMLPATPVVAARLPLYYSLSLLIRLIAITMPCHDFAY